MTDAMTAPGTTRLATSDKAELSVPTSVRACTRAAFIQAAAVALVAVATVGGTGAGAEPITSPAFPGKCVEAHNGDGQIQRGGALRLADCNALPAQDFRFDNATSTLRMPRLAPPLCLGLLGPPQNGAGVTAAICNDQADQKWAFPFNGRLRPVGVDPNKCLTHATRPGKPATGWTSDVVVTDPGCEFPEVGGGGFCFPQFAFFFEMMITSCAGLNVQQWALRQEGMPFPPGGIVSTKTHVAFSTMKIDDCREAGSCDWKLTCGLGNQADTELVGKVDMNTGGTINVGRSLVHEGGLPVTVTCEVREFDRGIFDPDVWEVVGTRTKTFTTARAETFVMDNSEGKVTVNLSIETVGVIQQPLSTEQPQALPTRIDTFDALPLVGIDFSVAEADLRDWLNNPQFTPYPAVAGALLTSLAGTRLRRAVPIDVIVFKYENVLGARSPRRVRDVDLPLLRRVVVLSHNETYGESVTDFQRLLQ